MATAPPKPKESQIALEASRFLIAVRQSLESSTAISTFRTDAKLLRQAYRIIDDLRFDFNQLRRRNVGRAGKDWSAIFATLVQDIDRATDNPDFDLVASRLPFRYLQFSEYTDTDTPNNKTRRGDSVSQALRDFSSTLKKELAIQISTSETQGGLPLRQIVPNVKIAPVQFQIVASKIALIHKPSASLDIDRGNIAAAKQDLIDRGSQIVEELSRSNCDKRLLDSIAEVQSNLNNDENVVQLGLSMITCAGMCGAVKDEVSDSLFSLVNSYVVSLGMYVSQFPDWRRFCENAATAALEPNVIAELYAATNNIVKTLQQQPDLSEPEVPQVIIRIRELIADPAVATKRSAFALIRTIENLFISIFDYGAEFLDKTARQVIDKLASVSSHAIVFSLMTLAVNSIVPLAPVIAHIPDAGWMIAAAEFARTHLLK